MILTDTSIWIDHLRAQEAAVGDLLIRGRVLIHPWIIGELAVGALRDRSALLRDLSKLDFVIVASDAEILGFIEDQNLFGIGLSYIDAGLLASTKLSLEATFWTRDKRLSSAAEKLGIAAKLTH